MDENRMTACEVLLDVEKNQSYSNLALNHHIHAKRPGNPGFVRELVYGVLENRIYLDHILQQLIPSGLKKVKKQDLVLLRMGLYQMSFMDSVPDYAAINESVKMARRLCKGREGFINGVLRGFQKKRESIEFPDRETDTERYLGIRYSAAPWIVHTWCMAYGAEKAEQLLESSGKRPRLALRVNLQKTNREELMSLLEKEGFEVKPGRFSDRVILVGSKRDVCGERSEGILDGRLFQEGWFSVQDQASVMAADALAPVAGDLVVDVCAAPGGKTMAMAEKMEGQGQVYAFDIYPHKLRLIEEQALRLQIGIVTTRCQDGRQVFEPLREKADCVLADVPCSGLGVLRRKPEIKYREDVDLSELIARQREILESAAFYVKPGGALVYSTCTINPAENQAQVWDFLGRHREFTLAKMDQILPDEETDGFFISKLLKR